MRISKVPLSGAVAAVAVAAAANAGVVDSFAVGASQTANTTTSANKFKSETDSITGLFNQRTASVNILGGSGLPPSMTATTFIGSGSWTVSRSANPASPTEFICRYENAGSLANLSQIASFGVTMSSNVYTELWFEDSAGNQAIFYGVEGAGAGAQKTVALDATNDYYNDAIANGFDWSSVAWMDLRAYVGQSSAQSVTFTNFGYTLVPAPGAMALLGAAGLVGGRRRRA